MTQDQIRNQPELLLRLHAPKDVHLTERLGQSGVLVFLQIFAGQHAHTRHANQVRDGYVSVTPLHLDMTAHRALAAVEVCSWKRRRR